MSNEKYIAGYQNVSPDWLKPLVDDFEATEAKLFFQTLLTDEEQVQQTIPIYSKKNLHPVKLKADCPIETHYKQGLRRTMLRELKSGDRQAIITKYENKVKEL
jgi:hypothetical protein